MITHSTAIAVAALALLLAGCTAGGAIGGTSADDQIVVQLDPSVPDLAAATVVAERDCSARDREAYLLTAPSAAAADATARPRAVFACRLVARRNFGGNNAAGAR
jgi:hypothetical protein